MIKGLFLIALPLFLPFMVQAQDAERSVVIINGPDIETNGHFTKNDLIAPVLQNNFSDGEQGFLHLFQKKPGYAFAGSAILPGFSQAANQNWIRAGLFFAIEAASVFLMVDLNQRARRGERRYEEWADQNWSVIQYSSWLLDYHDQHGLDNPFLEDLREMLDGLDPSFNPARDWEAVNISLIRNVERNAAFITTDSFTANSFSHTLPDYGSQQYYELIAKYYQFQAGWKDYHPFHDNLGHTGGNFNERFLIDRNGHYASPLFFEGAQKAGQFNDQYRMAGHFTSLLIINHVFSAFDAYFSVSLKQNRLQATPSLRPGQQIRLTYRF
ncbi:MAG: hypothetical protein WEA56_02845 [Balneolaceae bacterium]